jgi:ribosome-associated protein
MIPTRPPPATYDVQSKESMINAPQSTGSGTTDAAKATLDPESILAAAGQLAADRKAQDIVAIDLRGVVGYADYLLICSGRTDRQTRAIHDALHLGLKEQFGLYPRRVEGVSEGHWVLMDYLDVVVHIFTPDTRERYRLEQLWGVAPTVALELDIEPSAEEATA